MNKSEELMKISNNIKLIYDFELEKILFLVLKEWILYIVEYNKIYMKDDNLIITTNFCDLFKNKKKSYLLKTSLLNFLGLIELKCKITFI